MMRSAWFGLGLMALALPALVSCRSRPPLTEARVLEQLDDEVPLVFMFDTGPDGSQLSTTNANTTTICTPMPPLDDRSRAAVAAGWIEPRCENNRIQFQLTAEGRRRSVHWRRYTNEGLAAGLTESPRLERGPEDDDKEQTHWYVAAAHYERFGNITIEPTSIDFRMRALVHGRWVPNDEGELLRRAGWAAIAAQNHEALFALRDADGGRYGRGATWYLIWLQPE